MVEVDLEMASISVFTWASHINVYVYLQITGSHACDGSLDFQVCLLWSAMLSMNGAPSKMSVPDMHAVWLLWRHFFAYQFWAASEPWIQICPNQDSFPAQNWWALDSNMPLSRQLSRPTTPLQLDLLLHMTFSTCSCAASTCLWGNLWLSAALFSCLTSHPWQITSPDHPLIPRTAMVLAVNTPIENCNGSPYPRRKRNKM